MKSDRGTSFVYQTWPSNSNFGARLPHFKQFPLKPQVRCRETMPFTTVVIKCCWAQWFPTSLPSPGGNYLWLPDSPCFADFVSVVAAGGSGCRTQAGAVGMSCLRPAGPPRPVVRRAHDLLQEAELGVTYLPRGFVCRCPGSAGPPGAGSSSAEWDCR